MNKPMRTEKEIREAMQQLNIELAETKGKKVNVDDCFIYKTDFKVALTKVTSVNFDSSIGRYGIEKQEFSSWQCGLLYSSMMDYEFNDKLEKISLEKYEELVTYFKKEIREIIIFSETMYQNVVTNANF